MGIPFKMYLLLGCLFSAALYVKQSSEDLKKAAYGIFGECSDKIQKLKGDESTEVPSPKRILIWNTYWNSVNGWSKIFLRLIRKECPVSSCLIVVNDTNNRQLEAADAVLFHPFDMYPSFVLPPKHPPDQPWIFFSLEAPPTLLEDGRSDLLRNINDIFNWTMTYRRDSDIVVPYGQLLPRKVPVDEDPRNYWKEKSGHSAMGVWMVSHCLTDSKREDFVREIQRYIKVDIFGKCSRNVCGERLTISTLGNLNRNECDEEIQKHFFYFAFENSICEDYVTEKFYLALSLDVVPVVLGGAAYSRIAPPNSYINALDFKSPKLLAKYLKKVASSELAYNKFFEWKKNFTVQLGHPFSPLICDLCAKLHGKSPSTPPTFSHTSKGTYGNMYKWFVQDSNCRSWKHLK